jgi:manganese/zinc/iron transport system substrate-binding protein
MNGRVGRGGAALAAAALAVAAAGPAAAARRPLVVCTTTMITDLARQISAGRADVVGIMKAGEDPHVYEPRPLDAVTIAKADVLLRNGLHLEGTLADIIRNKLRPGAVDAALAEDPRIVPRASKQYAGAPDPHCWFNVRHFMVYAERARDALIQADPEGRAAYAKAAAAYLQELDALDRWVRKQLETIPRSRRVLVTSHDAFEYFGAAYDVEVHGVIGISTEQEPRPQDVESLVRIVRDRGVKAVFVETSVSPALNALVQRVSERTGVKVGGTLYSDSLGEPGGPAGTYAGMIRHNVKTIVGAWR